MIQCLVASSILILAVIFLRLLFRKTISRRMQYAMWGLVLLRLLLPFSLPESPASIFHLFPQSEAAQQQVYVLPVSREPVGNASNVTVLNNGTVLDANSSGYSVLSDDGTYVTRYMGKMTLMQIFMIIWGFGAGAAGLWFLIINIRFYRKLRKIRRSFPVDGCKLNVYIAEGIASPCLFGVFRPAIYLTQRATESDGLPHVLAHELCHYRHGDHIWSLLRGLCLALWWFNPLVWAAAALSKADSELACDEGAIARIGEEHRISYGRTLVDMIAVKRHAVGLLCSATTMASNKRGIQKRLHCILQKNKVVIPAVATALVITALCVGCTFTAAGPSSQASTGNTASSAYTLTQLGPGGRTVRSLSPVDPEAVTIIKSVLEYYQITSAAWPAVDPDTLDECLRIDVKGPGGEEAAYFVFRTDDRAVIQASQDATYSSLDESLYDRLAALARSGSIVSFVSSSGLDSALSSAILNQNTGAYTDGDFAVESHVLLGKQESESTLTAYVMALYLLFHMDGNGGFTEVGGGHMPVAITFEKQDSGAYILSDYWQPSDGSYYAPSIREKFPEELYGEALDTQKYITVQVQSCYAQMIAHGGVDTDGNLKKLLETICSSPAHMSNPRAYIDAHPVEYRELIYYGEHTLRYCFAQFEAGGQTGLTGHIMASACREILEMLDGAPAGDTLLYTTGQEWYDACKAHARELWTRAGDATFQSSYPGLWVLIQVAGADAMSGK